MKLSTSSWFKKRPALHNSTSQFTTNMTSRWCSREKDVIVAVYVERPRRSSEGRRHYHQNVCKNKERNLRGQNRRAELLDYTRHLRASNQSTSVSIPSHSSSSQIKPVSKLQISSVVKKRKHSSHPTCLDKWECLIPSFLRSMNTAKDKGTMMKSLVKSSQVQKKGNFLSELLRKLKKRR